MDHRPTSDYPAPLTGWRLIAYEAGRRQARRYHRRHEPYMVIWFDPDRQTAGEYSAMQRHDVATWCRIAQHAATAEQARLRAG